jgi:hypothetical protein
MRIHDFHFGDPDEEEEEMLPPRELSEGSPTMNGRPYTPLIPLSRYKKTLIHNED